MQQFENPHAPSSEGKLRLSDLQREAGEVVARFTTSAGTFLLHRSSGSCLNSPEQGVHLILTPDAGTVLEGDPPAAAQLELLNLVLKYSRRISGDERGAVGLGVNFAGFRNAGARPAAFHVHVVVFSRDAAQTALPPAFESPVVEPDSELQNLSHRGPFAGSSRPSTESSPAVTYLCTTEPINPLRAVTLLSELYSEFLGDQKDNFGGRFTAVIKDLPDGNVSLEVSRHVGFSEAQKTLPRFPARKPAPTVQ